jgi:hypothetical protein
MRRIRWFEPDKDDPSSPVAWPAASLVTATLFLNWSFTFQASGLWQFCPLPLYALLFSIFALLLTGLFFIGPALAIRAAGRPLFLVIEDSLGSIPAFGVRFCCVSFLVLWMATLIGLPMILLSNDLERQVSSVGLGIAAAAVLMFLFFTGQQSFQTRARLAAFTNKLGLAVLLAAFLRVHEGWPALLGPFSADEDRGWLWYTWSEFSMLALYVAPLALLAADLARRSHDRRQVAIFGLMGLALPIFVALFLVGVIGTATHASPYYQPSLQPTVAMALWSKAARSALPGRVLVAAVTVFGAVRFGGNSLVEATPIRPSGNARRWLLLACFSGAIAWCSLHLFAPAFFSILDWSARCLAVTGAVITIDFLTGKRRAEQARRVDWVSLIAVVCGLATPLYVSHGPVALTRFPGWYPWVLPSYVVAFLMYLGGRVVQKILAAKLFQKTGQSFSEPDSR